MQLPKLISNWLDWKILFRTSYLLLFPLKYLNEMNFIRVYTNFFLESFKSDLLVGQKVCSVVLKCSNLE